MKKLEAMLDDTGKKLFDDYCDAQEEIEGITRYDTCTDALNFGVRLMVELLTDSGTDSTEDGDCRP